MSQIRPIKDLRNTSEISEFCHQQKEPVFITKNGYGDLVIMRLSEFPLSCSLEHLLKFRGRVESGKLN